MFLKILLLVVILISLLFLGFSFKLVFNKKPHSHTPTDNMPSALTDLNHDKNETVTVKQFDTE